MPLYPIAIRIFLRLLLGLLLLSVGASKLARPGSFRRGLQDYQLLSSALDSRLSLSAILTYGLPIAEILRAEFRLCTSRLSLFNVCLGLLSV